MQLPRGEVHECWHYRLQSTIHAGLWWRCRWDLSIRPNVPYESWHVHTPAVVPYYITNHQFSHVQEHTNRVWGLTQLVFFAFKCKDNKVIKGHILTDQFFKDQSQLRLSCSHQMFVTGDSCDHFCFNSYLLLAEDDALSWVAHHHVR